MVLRQLPRVVDRHDHLDVGSCWVAADAGRPACTEAGAGTDRYSARLMGSGWHNLPAPGTGQEPEARHVQVNPTAEAAAPVADEGPARVRLEQVR